MKKLVILLSVALVGCAAPTPIYTTVPATTPARTATTKPASMPTADVAYETRMVNETWLSPGKVQIANLHSGSQAEWNIRLHNGEDEKTSTQSIQVGTEPNESVVPIKLKSPLANSDISSVVALTSDLREDDLKVDSYNSERQELVISGFASEKTRIITLVYKSWARFAVSYFNPENTSFGFSKAPEKAEDWVIIADPSPVLAPKETREILITVSIPEDTGKIPEKWEFWIKAYNMNQGQISIELASRWLVAMR